LKKTLISLVLAAWLCLGCTPADNILVISNATIIDGTGAAPRPGMTVVIDQGRISEIGETGRLHYPRSARIIDGTGKYLIPGLWDMHVHLRDLEGTLPLFVVNGVTTVRDMGSDFEATNALREQIAAGTLVGPRIKTPGRMLESTEWLDQYVDLLRKQGFGQQAEAFLETRVSAGSTIESVQAVEALAASGVDFVKIRHAASKEAYLAIARAAEEEGFQLVGHSLWIVSLIETADAGQQSIEHNIYPGFNDREDQEKKEIFDALIRNGTHLVPTLVAGEKETKPDEVVSAIVEDVDGAEDERNRYVSNAIRVSWRETMAMNAADEGRPPREVIRQIVTKSNEFLRQAHEAGVAIMAGTDAPTTATYFGFSLHDELRLLVESYGMTPMEALRSATSIPAAFMGMDAEVGTIERGKIAEMILLDADPLTEIANTRRIDTVIIGKRAIDRAERESILGEIASAIADR
jgi:imidazolonepropionase-like amidohydrolase